MNWFICTHLSYASPSWQNCRKLSYFWEKEVRFVDTLIANTLNVFKEHATSPWFFGRSSSNCSYSQRLVTHDTSRTIHWQRIGTSESHYWSVTDPSQTIHRTLADHSQRTHRSLTEQSQSVHRPFTARSQRTHRLTTERGRFFKLNALRNMKLVTRVRKWRRFFKLNAVWNMKLVTRIRERSRLFTSSMMICSRAWYIRAGYIHVCIYRTHSWFMKFLILA